MIAEIIEFNEETEDTHKTWKQKEFNRDKMVEESVDILFFYLQLVNLLVSKDKKFLEIMVYSWDEIWEEIYTKGFFDGDTELQLIKHLSDTNWCLTIAKCLNLMSLLVTLYMEKNITREVVEMTYIKKWNKNMERINKDWSL